MKLTLRLLAVAFFVAMAGMYAKTTLTTTGPMAWVNQWRIPALVSLALLIAVFVLTMRRAGTRGSVLENLGSSLHRPKLKDPVAGTAHVVTASGMPRSGQNMGSAMCEMNLVFTIPGQPSVAVSHASIVKLAQWPAVGSQLPVLAERQDPSIFQIQWDQVATGWDQGRQQAQALADQFNTSSTPFTHPTANQNPHPP